MIRTPNEHLRADTTSVLSVASLLSLGSGSPIRATSARQRTISIAS